MQPQDQQPEELSLPEALAHPEVREDVLRNAALAAIADSMAHGQTIATSGDERVEAWWYLVDDLAWLADRHSYVGEYTKILRQAVEHASALPPADLRVAAVVLVDRLTATAESQSAFREGIRAATTISPNILHPKLVVDRVLRTALKHSEDVKAKDNIRYALEVTLEALAGADEPSLSRADLETLQDAIGTRPKELYDLHELGERLHKKDRKAFLPLLAPPKGKKRRGGR
jgi:hypothetical protein